jgi:hypothetical protein
MKIIYSSRYTSSRLLLYISHLNSPVNYGRECSNCILGFFSYFLVHLQVVPNHGAILAAAILLLVVLSSHTALLVVPC